MMAKVWCVQMTLMLGHDVLFQDVDVVWYRDPLEFFQNSSHHWHNFDIYFQDDGNHALFYAPYSSNTGFVSCHCRETVVNRVHSHSNILLVVPVNIQYFVRNNPKTIYFFNSLLVAGDLVLSTHSHQVALVSLLNEHASMYNLKVKTLPRDGDEFPGGYHFHYRKQYMKDLFAGKVE